MPIKLVPLFTVHISILQSQCKWIPEGEPGKVEINSMLAAIGPVLSSSYPNRRSRFRYYQDMLNRTRAPLAIPLILAAAIALPARSQQISFEVASVKPQPWTGQGSVGIAVKGNTLYGEHVALTDLVQFAYNLRDGQISGGPSWASRGVLSESELFQVIARAPEGISGQNAESFRLMLQELLKDRFRLTIHHKEKEMPAWNIAVARGGPKLKESSPGTPPDFRVTAGAAGVVRLAAKSISVQRLIDSQLRLYLGGLVVDKTNLPGLYDFTLEWAQENPGAPSDSISPDHPTLTTALTEQLGLRAERASAKVDSVVIDHAERPSVN